MKECLGTVGVMASALRRVKHSFVLRSHSFVTSYVDGIFAPYSHRCNHHSMPQLIPDYPGHKPPRWRYLRSFLPVIVLILLFFFLSSYSLLSHSKSPAAKQHIGWQAWDVVDMTSQTEEGDNEEVGNETGNSNGTDTTFIPSIPLDNWVSTMICSTYRIAHASLRIL